MVNDFAPLGIPFFPQLLLLADGKIFTLLQKELFLGLLNCFQRIIDRYFFTGEFLKFLRFFGNLFKLFFNLVFNNFGLAFHFIIQIIYFKLQGIRNVLCVFTVLSFVFRNFFSRFSLFPVSSQCFLVIRIQRRGFGLHFFGCDILFLFQVFRYLQFLFLQLLKLFAFSGNLLGNLGSLVSLAVFGFGNLILYVAINLHGSGIHIFGISNSVLGSLNAVTDEFAHF